MAGWLLGIEPLKRVLPGLATMKFNTAFGFVLVGAALWGRDRPAARVGLGLLAALLGALTLGEEFAGYDFGIDQVAMHEAPGMAGAPGRMSPIAALGFVFSGAALGLMGLRRVAAWRLAEMLALSVAVLGGVALTGYLLGAEQLYRVPGFVSVALHTAMAFVILAAGLLCAVPEGVVALLARSQATGRALWLGFGALTLLLAATGIVSTARLQLIADHVDAQADIARPRNVAVRLIEVHSLDYALAVREHLSGDPEAWRRTVKDADEIARHLAAYQALAKTPVQRELAGRCAARWGEFRALGDALLETHAQDQEGLARLSALGRRLETFLTEEMQPDALADYEARRVSTLTVLAHTETLTLCLLVAGVILALVTSAAVARAVFSRESALAESEANFRGFFDNIALGAAQLSSEGRFLRVSDRYCAITGYRREELLSRSPLDLDHPDDREADRERLGRFLREETPLYDVEKRYVRKDGQVALTN